MVLIRVPVVAVVRVAFAAQAVVAAVEDSDSRQVVPEDQAQVVFWVAAQAVVAAVEDSDSRQVVPEDQVHLPLNLQEATYPHPKEQYNLW